MGLGYTGDLGELFETFLPLFEENSKRELIIGPSDLINLYHSQGTIDDPIQIIGNQFRGGGPHISGGGILVGDGMSKEGLIGGSYVLVKDNILVNPGQYGFQMRNNHNVDFLNNTLYSDHFWFNNAGYLALNTNNIANCSENTIKNNISKYFSPRQGNGNYHNDHFPNKECEIDLENNDFPFSPNSATNSDIDETILPENLLSADLMLHYAFNNNLNDGSGNNRTGTNSNNTIAYQTLSTGNSSAIFDGNNHISIPDDKYRSLSPINEKITISTWLKPNGSPEVQGIAKSPNSNGYSDGWRLIINGTNITARINIRDEIYTFDVQEIPRLDENGNPLFNDGEPLFDYPSTQDSKPSSSINSVFGARANGLNIDEWNHIAFTYNAKHLILYINGEQRTSTDIPELTGIGNDSIYSGTYLSEGPKRYNVKKINYSADHINPMIIGGTPGEENFNGQIDEFKLYRGALKEEEIKEYYVQQKGYFDGLIAHYAFNNNFLDSSVNNLNGTNNGVSFEATSNYSVGHFDGNSFFSIPSNELLKPENITISAWIKPNDLVGINGILRSVGANGYTDGWRLITSGNRVVARVTTSSDKGSESIGVPGLIEDAWNHVAFTYDKNNITVYVNGVSSRTTPLSGDILYNSNASMRIGGTNGEANFDGQIDNVKIYNTALSNDRINEIYNLSSLDLTSSSEAKSLKASNEDILISIYPNPITDGIMNIEYTDFKGGENIQIIDTSGRVLITEKLKGIQSTFDISNLESSIYFVKILSAKETIVVKKILVQ